jgi:tRNA(Ile)-lysidine synthase
MTPNWLPRVARRIARWAEGAPTKAWVVAVSGGSDSVGLLRVLKAVAAETGLRLSVAHLDHGARGEGARADAAFVAELATALELPSDLGTWSPTRESHFEADARRARYAWLGEVARERGASIIAVGHTSDDQAETVLQRVVRGTGLHGLAGIPARRRLDENIMLVRPLLDLSRSEIRDYLDALGQPFRDDPTNVDVSRTRARLRHDLLPKLAREYNPKVAEALARLAKLAGAASMASARQVTDLERAATLSIDRDGVTLARDILLTCSIFLRAEILRRAWRRAGWPEGAMTAARWNRLARLVRRRGPWRGDMGVGVVVSMEGGVFRLCKTATVPETPPAPRALAIPGSLDWRGGRLIVTLDPDAPRDETIDLDRVAPPLCVRAPRPGDRFNPLGLGTSETPLNDFFRGRGVARVQRPHTPLVCDREGIVWVVGHRIADRVRLTDQTTRRAGLRFDAT